MVPTPDEQLPCLRARADPRRFVEATGTRMAWLGRESGVFELWMWPLRLARGIELRVDGQPLAPGAREVEVRPDRVALLFESADRRWRACWIAAHDLRVAWLEVELLEGAPATLELVFPPDFSPQWPAGLGGRIAACDAETGALVLTEELGRFAALVGAEDMLPLRLAADHGLGAGPVVLRVPVAGGGRARFRCAGAELDPGPLSAAARLGQEEAARGFARADAVGRAARARWLATADGVRTSGAHWQAFLARTTSLDSDDEALARAFLWAKIAIERAWVEVDGLGRGLVAGLREGGATERPGFGWFFDGDALTAARAMCAYGDFEGAKDVLRFAASHQRSDGKLMHELVLSARLCDWVREYPYAYYKAGNTPAFLAVLEHVVRCSGDHALARELLPAAERALGYCEQCLDVRGLISNRKAGLAAVEAGVLVGRIESEIFLAGIWISGLRGIEALARGQGRDELAARAEKLLANAQRGFEDFWSEERQRYGFARLADGSLCDELTAYTAHPLSRGIGEPLRRHKTSAQLNRPELASGWGPRMFSTRSSVYDPADYNTGSVFPYLANFNVIALFEHGQVLAAWQQLRELLALDGFSGLGFVPEHLRGDRREEPPRGVPHQIFSSAALVQSVVHGLLGIRPGELRPLVFPGCAGWRFGELRFALDAAGRRLRIEGAAPECRIEPRLPHGSRARRLAPGEFELEFGPWAEFVAPLRILESEEQPAEVRWRVAGPAGGRHALPFRCDRPCRVSGASLHEGRLELRLPDGPPDAIVEHVIEFQLGDGEAS